MQVAVQTLPQRDNEVASQRETDLSKPGNVKWLVSHIKWAAKHSQTVVIRPIL